MKDELGGTVMTKFVGLRVKTYSYLINDGSEDKKAKGIKKPLNFKIIKTVQKQLDNKIKYLEKNKINIISLQRNHKEFIKTMN